MRAQCKETSPFSAIAEGLVILDWDVHFEVYAIGWSLLVVLLPFPTSANLCANITLNPSWHPSKVIMKGVLSKCGALSTGSDVSDFDG